MDENAANSIHQSNGCILYDGECSICQGLVRKWEATFRSRGFSIAPLQEPWVAPRLALSPEHLLDEMKVIGLDGKIYGGADAFIYLSRHTFWGWPLYAVSLVPGARRFIRAGYRWFASRRRCVGDACSVVPRIKQG